MRLPFNKKQIYMLLGVLTLVAIPSIFFGTSTYLKHRSIAKEYNIIKNNINKPLEKAVTDAGSIRSLVTSIPNSELLLTAEFSAKDKTVIRSIHIDDLDSTEGIESLEFTIRTTDLKESLSYLAVSGFAFTFIDVTDNNIMFRILIEGVK